MLTTLIIAVCAALVAGLIVFLILKSEYSSRLALKDGEILAAKSLLEETKRSSSFALDQARKASEDALKAVRETQKEALEKQVEAIRAEMTARTEEILKAREAALEEKAKKTFEEISGSLGKDLKEMKDSFEKNKQTQNETSAALKENIENAVKNLAEQTADIGAKADNLAGAMRGEVKTQGIWGEALFENMLEAEGFVKGRDYNREDVLRDDLGFTVESEEGKGLRPDFVLHYPDNTDVIVDSKVSLNALNDYISAKTDDEKADAAARNLDAVKKQIGLLAKKDYVRYRAKSRRKTLDYVIMFIPNYGAFQLAKQSEPSIWRDAFSRNVLIVTEETAMPFLRMIRAAWASYDQVRSQQLIVESAQNMLDRVSEFAKAHAEMGAHLEKARECFDRCDAKLRDSGKSITVSARQIIRIGVPANPAKPLPEPLGAAPEEAEEA